MDQIIQQFGEAILVIILTPICFAIFRYLAPIKSFKKIEGDIVEQSGKLENKRTLGCFIHWIVLASLIFWSKNIIWQPIFDWINQYHDAVFIEKIDFIYLLDLAAFLAFPLAIISTNAWFKWHYGEDKFIGLQHYYTNKYGFDNLRMESILLRSGFILAFLIFVAAFTPIKFVNSTELCMREEFSFTLSRKQITDIEKIEYIEGYYDKEGNCSGWAKYIVFFNNNQKIFSKDINKNTPEANIITHNMYKFLSEKSGKTILNRHCINY